MRTNGDQCIDANKKNEEASLWHIIYEHICIIGERLCFNIYHRMLSQFTISCINNHICVACNQNLNQYELGQDLFITIGLHNNNSPVTLFGDVMLFESDLLPWSELLYHITWKIDVTPI